MNSFEPQTSVSTSKSSSAIIRTLIGVTYCNRQLLKSCKQNHSWRYIYSDPSFYPHKIGPKTYKKINISSKKIFISPNRDFLRREWILSICDIRMDTYDKSLLN